MSQDLVDNTDSTSETQDTLPARADDVLPQRLYLVPSSSRPFFPSQVQPVSVSQNTWESTLDEITLEKSDLLGVCYVDNPENKAMPSPDSFPTMGCAVRLNNIEVSEGKIHFVARGLKRFRITRWIKTTPPFLVEVEYPEKEQKLTNMIRAYGMSILNTIKDLLPLNPLYSEELKQYMGRFSPNEPSALSDFATALTSAEGDELQKILECIPLKSRMQKVLLLLRKELEVARLQSEISDQVDEKISLHQREFFLKEQLKIIQQELGLSKDDKTADAEEFENRLERLNVPAAAQKRIDDELRKLSFLETGSPEYGVTRNYLDWATSVPWGKYSQDNLNLKKARIVLNQHHDGLEDVKDRIIEFLAVGAYKQEIAGSIMLLVGPPGVGKTSIGHSVADALGRKFYRFSLGGMRDEAEIKGHRKTYIGSMPGKLVQALKEVDVANPVIMLDEIDKIGASYQGDPASALLEVLDPEQNSDFLDHYLDLRVDLSKVLFICTANQLDSIPGPLLDRMDTIRLSGYIAEEKKLIARNHLWPKLLKRAGLKSSQLKISDAALKQLIEGYAREAGVRNLDKLLQRVIRKAVVKILDKPALKIALGAKDLEAYLGSPYFKKEKTIRAVGVVTGLAWTSMGGTTLPIEVSSIHTQTKGFKLTGQMGDVMIESAEIAHSYLSANVEQYNIDSSYFNKRFVHMHIPEGAIPKDGPSAGITMTTALLSMARNKRLPRNLAMTGEMTLTGLVLPVGGIREKVIAARRINIKELILPADNQRDYEELPEHIKQGMNVHFAQHYSDVEAIVFD